MCVKLFSGVEQKVMFGGGGENLLVKSWARQYQSSRKLFVCSAADSNMYIYVFPVSYFLFSFLERPGVMSRVAS